MQALVIAGGLGTRCLPYTRSVPKFMLPINKLTFSYHFFYLLKQSGHTHVVLALRKDHKSFGNQLKQEASVHSLDITIDIQSNDLNDFERVLHARDYLADTFTLCYSDNFPIGNFNKLKFLHYGCLKQNLVYLGITNTRNKPGNIKHSGRTKSSENELISYSPRRSESYTYKDLGFSVIPKHLLYRKSLIEIKSIKLFLESLSNTNEIMKGLEFITYHSIGDKDRYEKLRNNNSKLILLDRDGTINKKMNPGEFTSIDLLRKASHYDKLISYIKKFLNNQDYQLFIVSNQPSISSKKQSNDNLKEVNKVIEKWLIESGLNVNGFLICPHNYLDFCNCRKPNVALLHDPRINFDIPQWNYSMIGDSIYDRQFAENLCINYTDVSSFY